MTGSILAQIRKWQQAIDSNGDGLTQTHDPRGRWFQCVSLRGFRWTRAELTIARLPPDLAGFRILQISDLHMRRYWTRGYDDLIERVQRNPPDLVLLTGDFVENRRRHAAALPPLRRLIDGLRSKLGIYGILGNHDSKPLGRKLAGWGVRMLDGRQRILPVGGAAIELVGSKRVRRRTLYKEFERPALPQPPDSVRIYVAHYPEIFATAQRWQPDIFLAGHTHGGQVCLPGGWPIIRHSRLKRRFCGGIHRLGRMWLVMNRGLGFSKLPVRLFCSAEVVEIVLRGDPGGSADQNVRR